MKKWFIIQSIILLGGSVFAWYTVIQDFQRFYAFAGTYSPFAPCVLPHPLATPCFYGAIAFVVALSWSVYLVLKAPTAAAEKQLQWLLIGGTVFAWGNFTYEVIRYLARDPGHVFIGCSGAVAANPIVTPCFYGATVFLIAMGWSFVIRSRAKVVS